MKNTKRALRRHHRARMANHARYILTKVWFENGEHLEWRIRRVRDNFTICSCWMCRNPRKNRWFKIDERITVQERKANDIYKTQLDDLFKV